MYDTTKPYTKELQLLIEQTWEAVDLEIHQGTYPEHRPRRIEFDHVDGIGTKGWYHWRARSFRAAALDAFAMNFNDLAMVRARPYKLQDHLILKTDDEQAIIETLTTLVELCKDYRIAITGGETSIQNTLDGMDLSLTMSGRAEESPPRNRFEVGDQLIGLPSSGLHSNGFTNIRSLFGPEVRPEFTEPTTLYGPIIFELLGGVPIHGMMHITGGAFTKIRPLLGQADVRITRDHPLKPQPIFQELVERGVSELEMYRTFNCGIGFVLAVPPEAVKSLEAVGGVAIGEVVPGTGRILIESAFSPAVVEF